jgi:cytochrome c oxidase subunit 2
MDRNRAFRQVAVAVPALLALAAPVAAQSTNRVAIAELNTQLLYVALPLVLFVELILVTAIYRFRDNDNPEPTADDPALELTWTAATAVILVFVGVSGYFVMVNPYLTPAAAAQPEPESPADETVEIDVVAYQWGWEFHYAGENVTTQRRLVIPAETDVRFTLQTRDVIHSIFVPGLGVKQDIIPGQRHIARTHATEPGRYRLYCAEFCGVSHSKMHGTVVVTNRTAYESWLKAKQGGATGNTSAQARTKAAGVVTGA